MPVPVKLGGFAVALLVTFGAAYGIGQAVGSDGESHPAPPAATTTTTMPSEHGGHS